MRKILFREKTFESVCVRRVSYILTTKNRAGFLEKTLLLCKNLVKSTDELIVIDGASSDNTWKVIDKFKDLIDVYVSEPDNNSAEALNKGMLVARGKYIKHLTDDDIIYPKAMEKAIKVMEKHPEVDLLICGGTRQRGPNISVFYISEGVNYGKDVTDIVEYGACGVGQIIRRKSLAITRLFPVDDCADFTFPIQCIASGLNVKFCRINLFHHPTYDHSNMIAKVKAYRRDSDKTMLKYFSRKNYIKYKFLRTWALWPEYTERLYKVFPASKAIFWPARIFITKVNKRKIDQPIQFFGTDLSSLVSNNKYKWDGGFS